MDHPHTRDQEVTDLGLLSSGMAVGFPLFNPRRPT